jgi:hypothetical protein
MTPKPKTLDFSGADDWQPPTAPTRADHRSTRPPAPKQPAASAPTRSNSEEPHIAINIPIPADLHLALKMRAVQEKMSLRSLVVQLLKGSMS